MTKLGLFKYNTTTDKELEFDIDKRIDFVVEYNHNRGYEIRETKESLQAWGFTDEEKQQQEQERVNNLTMTALDFIGVLQGFELTLEQINNYLESNLPVKMQLTYCQNVYCGVVKQLMPIQIGDIEINAEMIEQAFKIKNGEITADEN